MDNLVVFITYSQEEAEKVAYQTSALNYHRYFIIVGYSVNTSNKYFRETDSYLEIEKLEVSNTEIIRRLALVYSPPNYENIALYTSNNIISLPELQNLFHDLLNGKHTKTDYLLSISRMNFVYEKSETIEEEHNVLEYSEIIDNAMMGNPIPFDQLRIALKELLPQFNYILDQSCMSLGNDFKNIILECNKKNYIPKLTAYYNVVKDLEKCIMFFDTDPNIQSYSTKLISIEGFVIYFRL